MLFCSKIILLLFDTATLQGSLLLLRCFQFSIFTTSPRMSYVSASVQGAENPQTSIFPQPHINFATPSLSIAIPRMLSTVEIHQIKRCRSLSGELLRFSAWSRRDHLGKVQQRLAVSFRGWNFQGSVNGFDGMFE